MKPIDFLKSKTFWGALTLAAAVILRAETLDASTIIEAIGILLTGVGLKSAIYKSGPVS